MSTLVDCLREHLFPALFIGNLGWDRASGSRTVTAEGRSLTFQVIAHKRGLQVFWCSTDRVVLCNRGLLRKFQNLLTRTSHEHIILFSSEEPRKQVWQWAVQMSDGRKVRHREHPFFSASPPPGFLERLAQMRFSLDEEEGVSLVDALDRVRRVLDANAEFKLFAKRLKYAERSNELAVAMRRGDPGAFQRFILLHLPLARKVAQRLQRWFGLDEDEAGQIGVLGLISAAQRFRPERGYQFATFAIHWIRQACQRYGPQVALLIRLPDPVFWTCYRHECDLERLLSAGGPSALRDRLSELECVNPWLANRWRAYLRARNVGTLSDRALLRQAQTIPDPDSVPSREASSPADGLVDLRAALRQLRARDARVIRLRYGFDGEEQTLEQVGQQLNVSRERVRQIQCRALRKLRNVLCERRGRKAEQSPSARPAGETDYRLAQERRVSHSSTPAGSPGR